MKLKKLVALALVAAMTVSMATGCSKKDSSSSSSDTKVTSSASADSKSSKNVTISFMTNVVGEKATALKTAVKGFEKETGIKVEFSAPGSDYEDLMKVKMGSNELPDVFTTHGWSVARYADYLTPVNDMDFFKNIDSQILPAITASNGDVYILPVDVDIAGLVYNVDVLDKAGINVDNIKTWADFAKACATLKAKGYEPIHMGGKDTWPIGQFFDWVAPSFYVTDESNSQNDALKSGKFDKTIWTKISQMMSDWVKDGYFNKDVLTADYNADIKALANGECGFCFYGNYAASDAKGVNKNAKIGMMPIPSNSTSDEPSLITGEDIAVGMWKDSKHPQECKKLLEYLAKPEVMSKIATAAGNKAGLTTATSDIGDIQTYLDKYKTVETFPYFDREYLPSGLWDVMCDTGAEVLGGDSGAVKDAATQMEQNFTDKFSAK